MGPGSYPRYGTHTIRIDLQSGTYKGSVVYEVGGNCLGGSILESTISMMEYGDFEPNMSIAENARHVNVDDDGYAILFKLYDPERQDDVLIVHDEFERLIVGVQIVRWDASNT
jgi:hypothetical protein